MPRPPARRPIVALALLLLSGPTAGGAAIPSYTVTDLGVEDFKVPLPAGDDATVTASDGRVYAFPRSIGDLVAPPEAYQTLKPPTPWSHEPYAYSFLDRSPGGGFLRGRPRTNPHCQSVPHFDVTLPRLRLMV